MDPEPLRLTLDEETLIRLRRILLDEDADEALEFIRDVIEPKLARAERPPGMMRYIDAGGRPGKVGGAEEKPWLEKDVRRAADDVSEGERGGEPHGTRPPGEHSAGDDEGESGR